MIDHFNLLLEKLLLRIYNEFYVDIDAYLNRSTEKNEYFKNIIKPYHTLYLTEI